MPSLLVVACGGPSTQTTSGGGSTADGGGGSGGTGSAMGGSGGSVEPIPVVFNEIMATGSDFVELMNAGTEVFDLSGYAVTDTASTGGPKIAEAARFPIGTELGPGAQLLLVAEQDGALGVGPQSSCLPTGANVCYYSTWGISDSMGEKLYILDPADNIVVEFQYPITAAPLGSSYGRFPDGTGDFVVMMPTPGEPNMAP